MMGLRRPQSSAGLLHEQLPRLPQHRYVQRAASLNPVVAEKFGVLADAFNVGDYAVSAGGHRGCWVQVVQNAALTGRPFSVTIRHALRGRVAVRHYRFTDFH